MKKLFSLCLILFLSLLPNIVSASEAPPLTEFSPAKTIETAVSNFLDAEMEKQAKIAENGWQSFIYSQGVKDISMNLEKFDVEKGKPLSVTFLLVSGAPDTKNLEKYQDNPKEWLESMQHVMMEHDTKAKVNLSITQEGSGYAATYAAKAEAALQKSVKSIATKTAKAFASKDILTAITDYLMPTPIKAPKKAPSSLTNDLHPAFVDYLKRNNLSLETDRHLTATLYSLKGYKLDASQGPDHFVLSFTTPVMDDVITEAASTLSRDLAYDKKAKQYTDEELAELYALQLDKSAAEHRHGKNKGENSTFTFSILSLPQTIDPYDFHSNTDSSLSSMYSSAISDVQLSTWMLPDYPAVPNPKNGIVSGKSTGTKCIFKAYDDGHSRSVSVYNSYTDQLQSIVFIESGSKVSIRIPQGSHYFVVGIGDVWYGPSYLFGENAAYSRTEDIEIASNRYYHTFTLNPKDSGNTSTYYQNYNDLIGQ